jgi:hypothetical protein
MIYRRAGECLCTGHTTLGAQSMLTPRGGFPADACKGGDRNLRGVGWGVEGSRTIANVRYSPFTPSDRMSSRSKTQEVRYPALALVKEGGEICTKVSGNQRSAVRMVTGKEHDDGRCGSTGCSCSSSTCDAWGSPRSSAGRASRSLSGCHVESDFRYCRSSESYRRHSLDAPRHGQVPRESSRGSA